MFHFLTLKPRTHWRQSWIQHFVESRPCGFGPVHIGNKVDCIGNKVERIGNKVDRDKLSNSHCCRFVVKTGNKVGRIRQQSTLLPVSATVDFQQSRPCWIQLCRQCVPGFKLPCCMYTKYKHLSSSSSHYYYKQLYLIDKQLLNFLNIFNSWSRSTLLPIRSTLSTTGFVVRHISKIKHYETLYKSSHHRLCSRIQIFWFDMYSVLSTQRAIQIVMYVCM